jgi:hypothetical protein
MRVIILVLLCFAALTSCAPGGPPIQFYVVIKPEDTGRLIGAVTSIAKDDGMETAVGHTTFNTGEVLRTVEGRGSGLKLWAQNVVLGGNEDSKLCGDHLEPYPDPAQFIVFAEPRFLGSKSAAKELGERVFLRLRKSGFDVRGEPAVCGAAAYPR